MFRIKLSGLLMAFTAGLLLMITTPGLTENKSPALDQLKTGVNQILDVLRDAGLKGEGQKKERRDKIHSIITKNFDFDEMAKRCLARNWAKLVDRERKEFAGVFSELLEASYIGKIEQYTNEEVIFKSEREASPDSTVVNTLIKTQNNEIPINYSMYPKGSKWWVYDVNIEGVSLIGNYRSQFNQILAKDSYSELIKRMKTRLTELRKEDK
ncbi:MAG: ABC transporter substrate-binding protein [Deltaproteobacteria bacterium]|nr:ABC transporter substrate-binding protein [Deltaproteobacteria bacterium]